MFNTQQNRKIVWDLMVDNEIFSDINPQYYTNIKREFELKMDKLALVPLSVVALNKQCITEMLEDVSKYKTAVTTADLQQLRDAAFNKGLQSKQSEFQALHTKPPPAKIDFTDKEEDKPIGSELDAMLAKTIAWRERELNMVLSEQDIKAASKWINPNDTVPTAGSTAASANIKLLKIGEEITNGGLTLSTSGKKHVNFQMDTMTEEVGAATFLSSLKQKGAGGTGQGGTGQQLSETLLSGVRGQRPLQGQQLSETLFSGVRGQPPSDILQMLISISNKQDEILRIITATASASVASPGLK